MSSATSLPKNGNLLPPMDLLDEHWFFNNTLKLRKAHPRPPKAPQSNSSDNSPEIRNEEEENGVVLMAPLMRTPSMPSPYNNGFDNSDHEESTQLNNNANSKGYDDQFHHLSSNLGLGCHHSWHSAFEKVEAIKPSLTRHHSSMPSRKYNLNHNYRSSQRRYKAFQEKKWNSSSDLESIEVQGFKDLGFVFDKKDLKEGLADVIPGLREREQNEEENDEKIARPYLSEAWYVERLAPPSFEFERMKKKSTAEMKDQLRFWAKAVACDLRQEC